MSNVFMNCPSECYWNRSLYEKEVFKSCTSTSNLFSSNIFGKSSGLHSTPANSTVNTLDATMMMSQ